jgi:hypothetical protein
MVASKTSFFSFSENETFNILFKIKQTRLFEGENMHTQYAYNLRNNYIPRGGVCV